MLYVHVVHCRATTSIKFTDTHLFTRVMRGTVRVKCLVQARKQCTWPLKGLAPRLLHVLQVLQTLSFLLNPPLSRPHLRSGPLLRPHRGHRHIYDKRKADYYEFKHILSWRNANVRVQFYVLTNLTTKRLLVKITTTSKFEYYIKLLIKRIAVMIE